MKLIIQDFFPVNATIINYSKKKDTFISRTTIERIRPHPHMEIRDELTARNHPITHKTAPQKSSGWSSVHKQDRRRCCCCRCDMHSYDRRDKEEEEDRQMYFLKIHRAIILFKKGVMG